MVAHKIPEHEKLRYAILRSIVKEIFPDYVKMKTGLNYIAVMSLGMTRRRRHELREEREQRSTKLVSFELLKEKMRVSVTDAQVCPAGRIWEHDLADPNVIKKIREDLRLFYRDVIRPGIGATKGRLKDKLEFRWFVVKRALE